jgi:hypothetical protein
MANKRQPDVFGGRFYGRLTDGGPLVPAPPQRPDTWICRRVADFPAGIAPVGAAIGYCARCSAPIAYNPGRILSVPLDTPQVCMQCAGIQPLPIEP